MLGQGGPDRLIKLRGEAIIPTEKILGLPTDLRFVREPEKALDARISSSALPKERCILGSGL